MSTLQVRALSKRFGKKVAVDNLSFEVKENSVFALLGPNGAGKSTTLRMLAGVTRPTGGEIIIYGKRQLFGQKDNAVGWLPDVPDFYGYMTAMQYLKLCGELSGIPKGQLEEKANQTMQKVGLEKVNLKISAYSRGMKQRLGLAQAILGEPKLIIMDEPVSALDPIGRNEILNIIGELKKNHTIIFSSHILNDAERICDYAMIINHGKTVLEGPIDTIKKQFATSSYIVKLGNKEQTEKLASLLLRESPDSKCNVFEDTIEFFCSNDSVIAKIPSLIVQNNLRLMYYAQRILTLEDIFLKVVDKA